MGISSVSGLAVGLTGGVRSIADQLPSHIRLRTIRFAELKAALEDVEKPAFVLGCLAASEYDVIELAGLLAEADISAPLVVLSGPLPNPQIVLREVAGVAPKLSVHLIEPSQLKSLSLFATRQ